MLATAFGLLRWSPDQVWRATPREIALALRPGRLAAPLRGHELADLMFRFPDREE